jgi:hypothetical protein
MGELLYLTHRKDGDPGLPNASETQTSHQNIARLLKSLEQPLCKVLAQATSLARKVEEFKKYLHAFDHLAGSPLDPSLQTMIREEARSSRGALLKASSELTRLSDTLAFEKAVLERDLSKFKASAHHLGEITNER